MECRLGRKKGVGRASGFLLQKCLLPPGASSSLALADLRNRAVRGGAVLPSALQATSTLTETD